MRSVLSCSQPSSSVSCLLQLLYDASRMAQRANRMAAVSPLRVTTRAEDGATPMAHPERSGWQAAGAQGDECAGSVAAGVRAPGRAATGATTPAVSVLSTSSFSPPQPLVLLAVRPLGRVSRSACLSAGRAGFDFEWWMGPTSVVVSALVLPRQPCPCPPCIRGHQLPGCPH